MLGTINAQFQSLFSQTLYVYTIFGVARGCCPLAYEKFVFAELNMHNFRPFLVFLKKYDFWWPQGGSPYKRMCIWGNHKCTIAVHFLLKFIRIYNFGVAREQRPLLKIYFLYLVS